MFSFTLNENLEAELLSPTYKYVAFPGGAAVNNSPANAGDARDVGSIPGSRRFPGKVHGNSLQYSFLGSPMDRGAWRARSTGSQRVRHNRNDLAHVQGMQRLSGRKPTGGEGGGPPRSAPSRTWHGQARNPTRPGPPWAAESAWGLGTASSLQGLSASNSLQWCCFFPFFFSDMNHFLKSLFSLLQYCLCFLNFRFLGHLRHVGSQLPEQGLNPLPVHWKPRS